MRKFIFAVFIFMTASSAYAGLDVLEGLYKSRPNQGVGCETNGFEIRIRNLDKDDNIEFITQLHDLASAADSEFTFRVLNHINKGWIPWRYDWGDGVATGKQITIFDGSSLTNTVKVGFFGLRTLTFSLKLDGDMLSSRLTDSGAMPIDCRYQKIH